MEQRLAPFSLPAAAPKAALLAAALVLAAEPAVWLVRSWTDPAYGSDGWAVALAVAGLAAWSGSSPLRPGAHPARDWALGLIAATLALRVAGQVLAVNTLSALALVLDVLALAALFRLDRRVRAVSPVWLAAAFLFALPLERVVQRLLGYGLQQVSAEGACAVLGLAFPDLACEGVRLTLAGRDVLVDLPCSGARGLLLLGLGFTLLAAMVRPGPVAAAVGIAVALAAALASNVLRISALAAGVALDLDVMAEPWHGGIGLAALALGALPLWLWFRAQPEAPRLAAGPVRRPQGRPMGLPLPAAVLALAVIGVSLPHRPVDVARAAEPVVLPSRIAGHPARPQPLEPLEAAYFTRFGGSAAKASYGPMGVMLVATAAPLRHLHAPDECLRGLGFRVEYRGLRHGPLPTAVYRATAPDGTVWRVEASFLSDAGDRAPSIGEAVWRWIAAPGATWTQLQRITPWAMEEAERGALEAALLAALDIAATR